MALLHRIRKVGGRGGFQSGDEGRSDRKSVRALEGAGRGREEAHTSASDCAVRQDVWVREKGRGPIMTEKLYVNVYAVTRHHGGPEEGGWYYNEGEPLGSVPVAAVRQPGHTPHECTQCDEARNSRGDERDGPPLEFCMVCFCDEQETHHVTTRDGQEHPCTEEECMYAQHPSFHVVAERDDEVDAVVARMKALFEEDNEGDIYSVLGGVRIEVQIQDHIARDWPEERPRYE